MQDSNTVTTTRTGGGARREPVMDWTTTMLVSRSARAALLLPTFFPSSFRSHVLPRAARAHLHSEDSYPSFQTPHTCLFVCRSRRAQVPISGLHLELNRVSRCFPLFSNIFFGYLISVDSEVNVRGFFSPFVFQDQCPLHRYHELRRRPRSHQIYRVHDQSARPLQGRDYIPVRSLAKASSVSRC